MPYVGVRYAFIVCNALQGVFIFIVFVLKKRILVLREGRMMADQMDKQGLDGLPGLTTINDIPVRTSDQMLSVSTSIVR